MQVSAAERASSCGGFAVSPSDGSPDLTLQEQQAEQHELRRIRAFGVAVRPSLASHQVKGVPAEAGPLSKILITPHSVSWLPDSVG